MTQMTPSAREFYKPHFNAVSWILMLSVTIPLDAIKLIVDIIPGVDLINLPISIAALLSINLYFFIKLGPAYLGGKKSVQKAFITLATWMIGLIPILDGLVPDETLDAVAIMWTVNQEDKKAANDEALAAASAARNSQVRQAQYNQYLQQQYEQDTEEAA